MCQGYDLFTLDNDLFDLSYKQTLTKVSLFIPFSWLSIIFTLKKNKIKTKKYHVYKYNMCGKYHNKMLYK